jgi:hypothetical protein
VDDDEAMTGSSGGSIVISHCRRATMEALQWGLPLTSAPTVIGPPARVCGQNQCWFRYPRHAPLLYGTVREEAHYHKNSRLLRSGHGLGLIPVLVETGVRSFHNGRSHS